MGDVVSLSVRDASGRELSKGDAALIACLVESVDLTANSVVILGRTAKGIEWRVAVKASDVVRCNQKDQAAINEIDDALRRAGIV